MSKKRNFMTEEQKQYIVEHYPYEQTNRIADKLGVTPKQVSGYAWSKGIKKDKDFVAIRKDNSLSLEEQDFLIENYGNMTNVEISKKLGIPLETIYRFARSQNLRKNNKYLKVSSKIPPDKKKFIVDNYATMLTKDISKIIGIDENAIRGYAHLHGIKRNKELVPVMCENPNGLTNEQKQFIIKNYHCMSNKQISEILGISEEKIHSYASNRKLTKDFEVKKTRAGFFDSSVSQRNNLTYNVYNFLGKETEPKISEEDLFISNHGKYHVNQDYFEVIDNEWKAYWLGFLYADGCVTIKKDGGKVKNSLSISLKVEDKEHVQKFLNSVQSDTIVRECKTNYKDYYSAKATINNQKICRDLYNQGCTPKKTFTLKFPNLRDDLIRHFVRGYFDGDGCISINKKNKSVIVSFVGTEDILENITQIFMKECGAIHPVFQKNGYKNNIVSVGWGNIYTCKKIYQYLYKDCNIYLDRKLKKFDTVYCLE